jgi:hypothetical protein
MRTTRWMGCLTLGLAVTSSGCYFDNAKHPVDAGPPGCFIGSSEFDGGSLNPSNACQACEPSRSKTAFTPVLDGTTCGAGAFCVSGACTPGCFIDGGLIAAEAGDPANSCLYCAPSTNATAWSEVDAGTSCGVHQFCVGGVCETGCFVDGGVPAAHSINPANPCELCSPASNDSAWTPLADGETCGAGSICASDSCTPGCFVSGSLRTPDSADPTDPCQLCVPANSTQQWTLQPDGTSCGTGAFCSSGTCEAGCLIDGGLVASGALDPTNPCEACLTAISSTGWSPGPDGIACGAGHVCGSGTCESACFIDGGLVLPGAMATGNACETCIPGASTTAWSAAADGTACTACNVCTAGACGPTTVMAGAESPWGLAVAGGRVYLTDYGNGINSGTLSRAQVDGGGFALLASNFVSPKGLTVLGDTAYFADYGGKVIYGLSIDGGAPAVLASGLVEPTQVTTYNGLVYYCDTGDLTAGFYGDLLGVFVDGGTADIVATLSGPSAEAVDSSGVYWADSATSTIFTAPFDGGPPVPLSTLGSSYGVATDADHVYWTETAGAVYELFKADGGVRQLSSGEPLPWGITTDGQNVYFVDYNNGAGTPGYVKRVPIDGGSVVTLATGGAMISVALDAQCVYWTSTGTGASVLRTDK